MLLYGIKLCNICIVSMYCESSADNLNIQKDMHVLYVILYQFRDRIWHWIWHLCCREPIITDTSSCPPSQGIHLSIASSTHRGFAGVRVQWRRYRLPSVGIGTVSTTEGQSMWNRNPGGPGAQASLDRTSRNQPHASK